MHLFFFFGSQWISPKKKMDRSTIKVSRFSTTYEAESLKVEDKSFNYRSGKNKKGVESIKYQVVPGVVKS